MPVQPYCKTPNLEHLWRGLPLRTSDQKDVLEYCRRCMGEDVEGNNGDQLTDNWSILLILLEALLSLYPSDDDISNALPEIPAPPAVPNIRKPSREQFRKLKKFRSNAVADQFYQAELTQYGSVMSHHRKQKQNYQRILPKLERRHALWKSLGGDTGRIELAKRVISSRLKLLKRFQDGTAGPGAPQFHIQTLPWELLPMGDWDIPWLASWLSTKARKGDRIEEQRLIHLHSLNPLAIYRSSAFSDRGYLAFVFVQDGSVALESAIQGNATYVLHREWKPLSRLTKRNLFILQKQGDARVDRLIHHNLGDWRYEVCRCLKIRIPCHSNEY
jgi:hypothetical protein